MNVKTISSWHFLKLKTRRLSGGYEARGGEFVGMLQLEVTRLSSCRRNAGIVNYVMVLTEWRVKRSEASFFC